jgi:hypothetical protein
MVPSVGIRPWRIVLAGFCAGLLLGGALPREGLAQARTDSVINPTGRLLELSVPLHYGKFYLGDLQLRLTPDQEAQVPATALLAIVKPLLREEAFSALSKAGTAGDADYCDLADLRQAGFDFRFDPGAVSIFFFADARSKNRGQYQHPGSSGVRRKSQCRRAGRAVGLPQSAFSHRLYRRFPVRR